MNLNLKFNFRIWFKKIYEKKTLRVENVVVPHERILGAILYTVVDRVDGLG